MMKSFPDRGSSRRRPAGLLVLLLFWPALAVADSREEIMAGASAVLGELRSHAPGVDTLLKRARGVLVFPDVVKMGFGTGGEYGEGALLIQGEPAAWYATAGDRHGLPEGASRKAEVILFMTDEALIAFRNTVSWQVGVHGEVDLVQADGATGGLRLAREDHPVLGFTLSDVGLLEHLDLNGNTINRIAR